MKYAIVLSLAIISFASCKRCYTCTTNYTYFLNGKQTGTDARSAQVCDMTRSDKNSYEKTHSVTYDYASPSGAPMRNIEAVTCK